MTSISSILDRLTDAQREAMFSHPRGHDAVSNSCRSSTRDALEKKGLVEPGRWGLTTLGIDVRKALRASEGNRS